MIELKPRFFVLPAIALAMLAMLRGPVDAGLSAPACGATLPIADPYTRASRQVTQSAAATRSCQIASNNLP
jgi:hypothetical protein